MKLLTVQLDNIVRNFSTSYVDMLIDYRQDGEETSHLIDTHKTILSHLLSHKSTNVVGSLRKNFHDGFTYMMLSPDEFNQLEVWEAEGEEYAIQVVDDKETLCLICKNEIVW